MRSDLPPDSQRSLDYASMIQTLKLLEGEEVCLHMSGGPGVVTSSDGAQAASRIQGKGILRHYPFGWAEGFALGDAVRVLLYEPDFVSAVLRTLDAVRFFSVSISLTDIAFVIGNPGYLEYDEFDLFP